MQVVLHDNAGEVPICVATVLDEQRWRRPLFALRPRYSSIVMPDGEVDRIWGAPDPRGAQALIAVRENDAWLPLLAHIGRLSSPVLGQRMCFPTPRAYWWERPAS